MSLKDYSTTAASNTSAPPNGAPEGMTLANVNNVMRQIMADVRTLAASDTIASATTCDLGTKDATFLTVSGTTTITGLGTVSAGIYKSVTFSGALTLTHNGTSLILPGAANITTVAGDTAMFLSLGSGNWKCMFYQPVGAYQPLDAQLTTLAGITAQQATDLAALSTFVGTVLNDADGDAVFTTLGAADSLSTSGYQKLPSGLIIQWGLSGSMTGSPYSTVSVTFPIAFPTGLLGVTASSTGAGVATSVTAESPTTSMTLTNTTSATSAARWIAVGY